MTTADLTFSVVVNTIDRAGQLGILLHALEQQSYPRFEVVVVVGPTHDNTLEVLSAYGDRVRVLRCPRANLSQSRNIGLLAARGDIVAYIDDDAVPCRTWLAQLQRLFQDTNLAATGGIVYAIHPLGASIQHRVGIVSSLCENVNVRASALDRISPPGDGRQWSPRMMGTNMAFRRQALLDVGGFDEFYIYIAEEADLVLRMVNAGMIVQPTQEAAVYHNPASSRNRIVFTHVGRWWWLETRSEVYHSIKNGPHAGDSRRAILLRCLHLVHGHWLLYAHHLRAKELTLSQAIVMSANEIRGAVSGVYGGLCLPRQLATPAPNETPADVPLQGIRKFQDDDSARQPAVDPISGYHPTIMLPDPPLSICLLSNTYPPTQIDGVARLTNLMARGLFELGHSVHVITAGEREKVSFYDGAYVHHINYTLDRYRRYRSLPNLCHILNHSHAIYEKVKRLMLNDGVQIVDSPLWLFEGLVTAVSGVLPVTVRLVTAQRQVSAIQGDEGDDVRLVGEMEGLLMQKAAHLLPNTQATLHAAQEVYGIHPASDRYTIVPYGIVPATDEAVRPFDPARTSDALDVLFVGRLEKRKGILDLFEAIPQVLKQIPTASFTIAGADNSQFDGFAHRTGIDYPTYFAQRYPDLGSRVRFLGKVSDDRLQQLYQACDLFVAPSLYESFGLIYLEAMNYAKPVIGCRAGGIPEVVSDGVTGLLADPEVPADLAAKIVSLLRSPTRLREMGLAGRQQILERFSYLQMARAFARVYRRVIQESAAGRDRAGQATGSPAELPL